MAMALVRYGLLRHVDGFLPVEAQPTPRQACLISTPRGVELGHTLAVLAGGAPRPAGISSQGRGGFVRDATLEDEARGRDLALQAKQVDLPLARESVERAGARVLAVERLFGGERVIVYYTASGRVDGGAMIRSLQDALGVDVHLQQVGARQRARMCGGAGVCGRTLCCSTFLRRMEPISMRMARVQGLELTPEVTAGACGRLKCCLRYENPLYEDHSRGLPRVGWRVRAERGVGVVLAVDVLRRQVLVRPEEGGARLVLFAEELLAQWPALRVPLPRAGEESALPLEGEPDAADEPAERGWSEMARRLWRRVRAPRKAEEDEE
jgi:cell fate regulator YaaT (PSP1 superfamily)